MSRKTSKKDWGLALNIILVAGAIIYLSVFTFFMILAQINGTWTYHADARTFYEIILVPILVLGLIRVIIVEIAMLE